MTTEKIFHEEKAAVWAILESRLGTLSIPGRSKDWRVTNDKLFSFFITYSKIHPRYQAYWYDVSRKDIDSWLAYENPYVILVAGSRDNIFAIPAEKLFKEIIKAGIAVATDGTYKFNVRNVGDNYVLVQTPELNLMQYRNNFTFIDYNFPKGQAIKPGYEQKTIYEVEESTEIMPGQKYKEGSTKKILVNAYERDSRARAVCIRIHGTTCVICQFNFEQAYGEHGKGFIHVHHLKPLAEIKEEYELDPIQDLRPVCPNCHAMIHRRGKLYSIEEIATLINKDR